MPEIRNPLRSARAAAIVGLWLSASLLGASVGRAQQCEVQIDRSPGGVIEGRTSAGLVFDPELEIEVAPDLCPNRPSTRSPTS
jgi:hypothetical protein